MKGFSVFHSDRRAWSPVGLGVFILVAAVWIGPVLVRDSASYLEATAYRAALYPTFLAILGAVFGPLQLHSAVAFQTAFGLLALARLLQRLGRQGLRPWPLGVAAALLAFPYLWPLAIGSSISSEGLAYPLFLLAVSELLAAAEMPGRGAPLRFALWSVLGVLARPQMLFLAPAGWVVLGWQWLRRREAWRGTIWLVLTVALTVGLGTGWLIEKGYHRWRHGEFELAAFTDLHLMASAIYVSSEDDVHAFPARQGQLLSAVRQRAAKGHLLLADNPSPTGVSSFAVHYAQVYNKLVWRTLVPQLRETLAAGGDLEAEHYFEAARLLRPVATGLIEKHLATWARLVGSEFLQGLGVPYALLLLMVVPLAAMRSDRSPLATLLLAAAALHLANLALVALIQVVRLRYSFYTDMLYLASLVAFLAGPRTED